jgi:hypothetical protein
MDCRSDDGKNCETGTTSSFRPAADDSGIPIIPVINPQTALAYTLMHGSSLPNPNFSGFAFSEDTFAK